MAEGHQPFHNRIGGNVMEPPNLFIQQPWLPPQLQLILYQYIQLHSSISLNSGDIKKPH